MKLIMLFIGELIILGSCNKSNFFSDPRASFEMDGTQFQFSSYFDGSNFDTLTGRWYGCYYLKSSGSSFYLITADNSVNGLTIEINSPEGLPVRSTYNEVLAFGIFKVNGKIYQSGQITVNIIRNHNGIIDGTFSARIGDRNGNIKMITDGQFFNFKKSP